MPAIAHDSLFPRLPYLLEHFAVAVAAISGVLAGRGKKVDLFGVLVLALVTSFGGGTLRDLMLGDLPVAWIRDTNFIVTACAAAFLTFITERFFEFPRHMLLVADAFALALFSASGARKALGFEVAPVIAVAMGVITGVAGGMVRDILTGEIPLVLRAGVYLYATASMLGAGVLVLLSRESTLSPQACMLSGIFVALALRLAAIRWRLVLPVFLPKLSDEKGAENPPSSKAQD
jgi:uncharacterized membrane protein YeiH